jgi:hypothetical protein
LASSLRMTGNELPGLWRVLECHQPARYAEITKALSRAVGVPSRSPSLQQGDD